MVRFPTASLCSQIHNSFQKKFRRIAVPFSKTNKEICQILHDEGFLSQMAVGDTKGPFRAGHDFTLMTPDNVAERKLWLDLKYYVGEPVLRELKLVSKPSRKVYASALDLANVAEAKSANSLVKKQALGQVTIIKTPYGIVELKEALKLKTGGEVLCIAR